jgi:uncharacterized membrane protein
MALRMVSRFYRTYADAVQAVADLTVAGVTDADISLIESEDDARLPPDVAADAAQSPASSGAKLGGGIGGGVGVLIGVGAITLPSFLDPVIGLGWLAPTVLCAVIGAAIGAVVGIATKMGVVSTQAHSFAAGLQRGEHLVMVRVDETQVPEIEAIMARTHIRAPLDAPAPPNVEMTLDETREAIHRDEQRIQYTSE